VPALPAALDASFFQLILQETVMPRALTLLAVAALSFASVNALRSKQQQRLRSNPRAKTEPLQTWEGEGGGLPYGGAAQTSVPADKRSDAEVFAETAERESSA
jgi:hypothetical protein